MRWLSDSSATENMVFEKGKQYLESLALDWPYDLLVKCSTFYGACCDRMSQRIHRLVPSSNKPSAESKQLVRANFYLSVGMPIHIGVLADPLAFREHACSR